MARDEQVDQHPVADEETVERAPVAVSVPEEGSPPPGDHGEASDSGESHDAVGAYVLDALPDDERLMFEAHLVACPACQAEVRELAAVVQVLPRVLEIEPPLNEQGAAPVPSAELRNRILAAVRAEQPNDAAPVDGDAISDVGAGADAAPNAAGDTLSPPPPPLPARPPGRVRSGVARPRGTAAEGGFWQTVTHLNPGWLAAATLAVVAIGAIIWALGLQGQVDDLRGEINAQNDEIAQLRGSSNATAALLDPTADGPSSATGTLYYSLQANQPPVLALHGMTPLSSNRVYQLWYIKGTAAPVPGPTFQVNDSGMTMVPVASDVPTFTTVAITAEPSGGSKSPTMPILMAGQLSGARG